MGTWTLVYATEPNEPNEKLAVRVVAGTLKDLRDAVVNAADVKVLYRPPSAPSQWRAVTCTSIEVKGTGSRTQVIARGGMALASNSPLGDGFAAESFMFHSMSAVAHDLYNAVNGDHGGGALAVAALRWYVRDYDVPFWTNARDQLPPVFKGP